MAKFIDILHYLSSFNTASIILRLFMATLLGGIVGIDRGLKKRPAGLRTFALVSVGSAIAMITNEYVFYKFKTNIDITRMAAQVISGVGFLGAGTIIVTGRQRVKGLTTAASLWATASMGIAIGSGFFVGAVIGFLCIMVSITILHNLDEYLGINSKVVELYIEADQQRTMPLLLNYIKSKGYTISSFEKKEKTLINTDVMLLIELNLRKRQPHTEIISEISIIDGVHFVEEIK